ncbi:MAG: hypothetical protein IJ131_08605, partial [Eggerthellaceae bacterium]|nr:hypothetical protein [Eggerthellaceae bacterium]
MADKRESNNEENVQRAKDQVRQLQEELIAKDAAAEQAKAAKKAAADEAKKAKKAAEKAVKEVKKAEADLAKQQPEEGKFALIAETFDGSSIVAGEAVAEAAEDATGAMSAIQAANAAATTSANVNAEGMRATLAGPNVVNKPEHPVSSTAAGDAEVDADDIMRKYDRESNTRIWEGAAKQVVSVVLVAFSVYCIFMTLFSTELPETRLARFLGFIVVIGYMMYPANKKKVRPNYMPWYDIVLMVVGAGAFFFFAFNAIDVINLRGRIEIYHVVLGVIGILVMAELCRRCVGIPILGVVGCLLAYALYYFIGVRLLDL